MSDSPSEALAPLPEGRLLGRLAFEDSLRLAFAHAAAQGWSLLTLADDDFSSWPLGERAVIESLNAWAHRGRRLRLLARHFAEMRRQHARFVQWRTTWSHLVDAHAVGHAAPGEIPSIVCSPLWTLERLDPVRSSFVASHSPERRTALSERLDQWWGLGQPSFAASTLGL